MLKHQTSRRSFFGLAAGGAAALATTPVLGQSPQTAGTGSYGFCEDGSLPLDRLGVQIFTVRTLMAENSLGFAQTMALLADAGIACIEIGGDFLGHTPEEFRAIVENAGMTVIGNHFGPRTMDGDNPWYSEEGRESIFAQASALGFSLVGTGHYYNVPLTVDGFTEFARNMNVWGEHASRQGMKFYFHNHAAEFTHIDGKPIYHILLENTDPELVAFELDLGWMAVAGEDVAALVAEHQDRFPYFHVKDVVWREDGVRVAPDGTINAGRAFDFGNVGHGDIDWAAIFSGLRDPSAHTYIIEHDDAGRVMPDEGSEREAPNPAGAGHTIWAGRKYLANLAL